MKKIELRNIFFIAIFIIINTSQDCLGSNVKKNADENREDNGETSDEANNESMDLPLENENSNQSVVGPSCARKMNTKMHEIRKAQEKQFSFVVALMSHKDEYLCCGSLVGNGLILTSAECSLKPIGYALLNVTKARKDNMSSIVHIIKTEKFPTYHSGNDKNVALIYTEKHNNSIATKVNISNASDFSQILDLEALGFGLNANVGITKELQYVGVENRVTPIATGNEGYFDCVETKVLTCFKDFGGPVMFDNDLVGIVTKGTDECTKEIYSTYSVNKKMIEYIPSTTFNAWLYDRVKKNEEHDMKTVALATYPMEPKLVLKTKDQKNDAEQVFAKGTAILSLLVIVYPINSILS